jgi:quinol-cytochrome oxidoreductase complex cytochrome b subunit
MNLTDRTRQIVRNNLTLDDLLPSRMPVYVHSAVYLFGVGAISGLAMLVLTGMVMSLFGPLWYHTSKVGKFVNSLHFWSVQFFFAVVVMHFIGKFLMAAWRDSRRKTWMAGVLAFGAAVFTGLTGFLSQTNWDAQWIAVQAKDAMNAMGIGAWFNTMNLGQVLTLHMVALPLLIGVLVGVHLFFVRRESPVKPISEIGGDHEHPIE